MPLHADTRRPSQVSPSPSGVVTTTAHGYVYEEPVRTGRYCAVCEETWHEPYAHLVGTVWHVPASNGEYYEVARSGAGNGVVVCACKGFEFRGRCKHVALALDLERQDKTHELAHTTWLRYEQARWPDDPTMDDLRGWLG